MRNLPGQLSWKKLVLAIVIFLAINAFLYFHFVRTIKPINKDKDKLIDSLTNQIDSLQKIVTKGQKEKIRQEDAYKKLNSKLDSIIPRIDSIEKKLYTPKKNIKVRPK